MEGRKKEDGTLVSNCGSLAIAIEGICAMWLYCKFTLIPALALLG